MAKMLFHVPEIDEGGKQYGECIRRHLRPYDTVHAKEAVQEEEHGDVERQHQRRLDDGCYRTHHRIHIFSHFCYVFKIQLMQLLVLRLLTRSFRVQK